MHTLATRLYEDEQARKYSHLPTDVILGTTCTQVAGRSGQAFAVQFLRR